VRGRCVTRPPSSFATTKRVKILYVSQYFPPEMGAPAARAVELSRRWATSGHEVTVLTGFPNHPTGTVPPEYRRRMRGLIARERLAGVHVVRTWLWPLPNRRAYERILNYTSFCLSAAVTGIFLSQPDVVIGTSPQLLVGLSGWWISRWKRVPFVFEVRDLWPESLSAVGMGDRSLLHAVLGKIAGFLYRRSEHIVVVTPAFKDHLIKYWNVPAEKISVVQNGVETDLFTPETADDDLKKQWGAEGKSVFCYIGTMGWAHGLDILVSAAESLKDYPVVFVLVGEGADKARMVDLVKSKGLTNLRILGQQPRDKIPRYIAASDACLVLLKKTEVFKTVIPTKMLEFMACGRPVILAVDGQARKIMESADAGVFVEPENSKALADAILDLASDPEKRERMGKMGREHILHNFSREQTAASYAELLQRIVSAGEPHRMV
jgi:colanic acid biosynthesis glycosyl transferase WcaI